MLNIRYGFYTDSISIKRLLTTVSIHSAKPSSGMVISKLSRKTGQYVYLDKNHTTSLDTIFVQIYMDALPGVPVVSKNQNFFTNKTVEFLR